MSQLETVLLLINLKRFKLHKSLGLQYFHIDSDIIDQFAIRFLVSKHDKRSLFIFRLVEKRFWYLLMIINFMKSE